MKEYKYKVKGAEYTVKINDVEGNMAKSGSERDSV